MARDVYEKLAEHLDNLPVGFPRTESGVEIRILRQLFAPEHAALTLHLTLIPEEPRVIARRAKIPVEDAARRLAEMDKKGLIFSIQEKGKPIQYQVQQFVVGFWDFQVDKLSRELAQDFEEYLPTYADPDQWGKAPQLRTIPVGESISFQTEVMPYERAEGLVRAQETLSVANCVCRQELRLLGEGCDKPLETCLCFGMFAEHGMRTGRTRDVSQEEALEILHLANEAGLVLQPSNAKDPLFLCACCGCCCGVLRSVKRHPKPASVVSSPFVASLNVETCAGCGTCTDRCQMEAVSLDDGKAALNLDRCIGCGLCVNTCPTHSLSLVRKPDSKQPHVPKDVVGTYIKVGQARGRMGIGELIGMQARSILDRLLAPR